MPDLTSWTALLVALSILVIAALRTESMSANQVALLTVGIIVIAFFAGKFIDGDLAWPLEQRLATELGYYIFGQQAVYQIIKKTSPIKRLEASGNAPAPPRGLDS